MQGHSLEHEQMMGSYFRRNYIQGERVNTELTDPEEWGMETWGDWEPSDVNKEPPRIFLREKNKFSNSPKLSSGHMEFKEWVQYRVEYASAGERSVRFLSEARGNHDNERADMAWDDISAKIERKFKKKHFNEDALSQPRINIHREMKLFDKYTKNSFVQQICRQAVKIIIKNSKTNKDKVFCSTQKCLMDLKSEIVKAVTNAIQEIHAFPPPTTSPSAIIGIKNEEEIWAKLQEKGFGTSTNVGQDKSPKDILINSCRRLAMDLFDILLDEEYLIYTRMTKEESSLEFGKLMTHRPNKFVFGKKILVLLDDNLNHPIFSVLREDQNRWMYCPPKPHEFDSVMEKIGEGKKSVMDLLQYWYSDDDDSAKPGGFLTKSKQKIVSGGEEIYSSFQTPRCEVSPDVVKALNTLQDTQWEINLDVLSRFCDIELLDRDDNPCPECHSIERKNFGEESECANCGAVIESQEDFENTRPNKISFDGKWLEKSNRIVSVSVKQEFQDLFFGEKPNLSDENFRPKDSTEVRERMKLVKGEIAQSINKKERSRYKEINQRLYVVLEEIKKREKREDERNLSLSWARRIIEHNANVFWHAWSCDFRGRLVPRCTHLSPHGDDFDRGLIRFKKWKPLGERGIYWLRVHVHNLMEGIEFDQLTESAQKGRTFEQRSTWVEENIDALKYMADNFEQLIPQLKLEKRRHKEDSIQRIAALLELNRVYTKRDSGLEWGEIESGQPVYLDGSCNGYQHLSAIIGDESLAESVNVYASKTPQDFYSEIANHAKENSPKLEDWLSEHFSATDSKKIIKEVFDRKLTKQPTMTKIYGAKSTIGSLINENKDGQIFSYQEIDSLDTNKIEKREKLQTRHPGVSGWYEENPEPEEGTPEYKRWWRNFKDRVKKHSNKGIKAKGIEKKAKEWHNLLREVRYVPRWEPNSLLYQKLIEDMRNDDPKISDFFKQHPELHFEFAKLIDKQIIKSMNFLTRNGLENLEKPMNEIISIIEEKGLLHPGLGWEFSDFFAVHNYDIKAQTRDQKSKGQSNKRYSSVLPKWYTVNSLDGNKSKPQTNSRIANQLYSIAKKKLDQNNSKLQTNSNETWEKFEKEIKKNPATTFDSKLIKQLHSEIVDIFNVDEHEYNELKKLLFNRPTFSLKEYPKEESARINYPGMKSAIRANFIHSFDAFHMRKSILGLSNQVDELSFWALHDAFGTHACDIDDLTRIVKGKFAEIHSGKNLQDWVKNMIHYNKELDSTSCAKALNYSREIKSKLDKKKILESTYLIA